MLALALRLRWVVALAPLAVAAGPAFAQGRYAADEVDKKLSSRGQVIRKFVQRGDGDEQEFRDYFTKYYFPQMTQPDPDSLGELGKMSGDLFKNYLYAASGANQKWLSDQTLNWAANVIRNRKYHPAVRLNALLVLGRIDDEYSGDRPVPSAKANDALYAIAMRAVQDGRYPRYELTAALTGMQRHARFLSGLPGDEKKQTLKLLYAVLMTDLSGDYAEGVKGWVYLQAADAIGQLGTAGPKGVFATALAKRVADETLTIPTRAELASTLGRLKMNPGEFDTAPLVKSVTALAAQIAEQESKVASAFENLAGPDGRAMVAAIDRELWGRRVLETDASLEPKLIREGLVKTLTDLRAGVRATNEVAGGKEGLKQIDDALASALRPATDKSEIDLNITDAVKRMARQVKAAASPALAPAEDAVANAAP